MLINESGVQRDVGCEMAVITCLRMLAGYGRYVHLCLHSNPQHASTHKSMYIYIYMHDLFFSVISILICRVVCRSLFPITHFTCLMFCASTILVLQSHTYTVLFSTKQYIHLTPSPNIAEKNLHIPILKNNFTVYTFDLLHLSQSPASFDSGLPDLIHEHVLIT